MIFSDARIALRVMGWVSTEGQKQGRCKHRTSDHNWVGKEMGERRKAGGVCLVPANKTRWLCCPRELDAGEHKPQLKRLATCLIEQRARDTEQTMAKPKQAPKSLRTRSRSKNQQPWYKTSSARNVLSFALLAVALIFASTFFTKSDSTRKGKSTPRKAAAPVVPKHKESVLAEDPTIPKIQPPARQLWTRTGTGTTKGMVATERIVVGNLLIYAKPLITVPAHENKTSPSAEIMNALNALSITEKPTYFGLPHNEFKLGEDASQEALALNIWEANAVHAGPTSSIFVDPAFITHSCSPNADYFYREDIDALVVHAVKPIAKGELITCPYFDASTMTRQQRQEHMHTTRGTGCDCQTCALEGARLEESDKNRARLGEIKQSIAGYSDGLVEPEDVLEGIEEAYELLKKEEYLAE